MWALPYIRVCVGSHGSPVIAPDHRRESPAGRLAQRNDYATIQPLTDSQGLLLQFPVRANDPDTIRPRLFLRIRRPHHRQCGEDAVVGIQFHGDSGEQTRCGAAHRLNQPPRICLTTSVVIAFSFWLCHDQHRHALMGCQDQPFEGVRSHPFKPSNSLLTLGPNVSHFR